MPEAEYVNPDGSVSRAAGLQGSAGLYIDVDGKQVEAADACARYLDQLRSRSARLLFVLCLIFPGDEQHGQNRGCRHYDDPTQVKKYLPLLMG